MCGVCHASAGSREFGDWSCVTFCPLEEKKNKQAGCLFVSVSLPVVFCGKIDEERKAGCLSLSLSRLLTCKEPELLKLSV